MALSAGARLGPYEIQSPLGAGGMGEVYRARDTRLERTVAVKVLPQRLSSSPEIRQRFEREAKTISQLSHPHICALYDVGREGETEYLVMEYLEGETLSERLVKGPLPLEQTLRYGVEIADALDKAHRQAIVHRDLKPGNVMLTKSGVKLLDFGLAKAIAPAGLPLTSLPTEASPVTQAGTILGTFQYMAPEQLEGKEADARTDIFAFGATLYEMATGKKAFSGATQASLISAILRDDPQPISRIHTMSPPALDRVVKTCLAKDPEDRWQSAADIKRELGWVAEGSEAGTPAAAPAARRDRERVAWAVSVILLLALLGSLAALLRIGRPEPAAAPVTRFSILPPGKSTFTAPGESASSQPALSPDGRSLAFVAYAGGGRHLVWVRPLDSLAAQALDGTEDGSYPFWSPDGRFLGFFSHGKLKRIALSGGPPQTLCDASAGRGAAWSRDGVIIFTPTQAEALYRIPAGGGAVTPATTLDSSRQESSHRWPSFLPDGRRFLYWTRSRKAPNIGIRVGSLDSKEVTSLLAADGMAAYARPGHLLFVRQGALLAQSFDHRSLKLEGEPLRVAEPLGYGNPPGYATFSVADSGVLAYVPGVSPNRELIWFDRGGKMLGSVGEPGIYVSPALSPDERRIAVGVRDLRAASADIWLFDLARGIRSRFTFDPANETIARWSPDGSRIVFTSNREGFADFYEKSSTGAGEEKPVFRSDQDKFLTDWSQDGRFLAYHTPGPKTGWDVWVLPLSGDRKPIPFVQTEFTEAQGQFSPDGKWLAYASDESGIFEVYVRSFPAPGGKWQVSTSGGTQPQWRRDGRELFYLSEDGGLMAVEVKADSTFEASAPRPLFHARFPTAAAPFGRTYSVRSDGQRFLVTRLMEEDRAIPITVVLNWTSELKK
ncbi:MAG TPA: protein kinase [Thermoanaerobaculia bacterium]